MGKRVGSGLAKNAFKFESYQSAVSVVNGQKHVSEQRVHVDQTGKKGISRENAFIMKNRDGKVFQRKLTKKQVDKIKHGEFIPKLFGGMRKRIHIRKTKKQHGGNFHQTGELLLKNITAFL